MVDICEDPGPRLHSNGIYLQEHNGMYNGVCKTNSLSQSSGWSLNNQYKFPLHIFHFILMQYRPIAWRVNRYFFRRLQRESELTTAYLPGFDSAKNNSVYRLVVIYTELYSAYKTTDQR